MPATLTKQTSPAQEIKYKRGRRDSTITSDRMTWESRCGQYQVIECNNHYEKKALYYAMVRKDTGWRMLEHMKTYRTRKAAETAIKKSLGIAEPKKKKSRKVKRK